MFIFGDEFSQFGGKITTKPLYINELLLANITSILWQILPYPTHHVVGSQYKPTRAALDDVKKKIAHQDYRLGGQINVVEYDDKIVFSNKGSFIPGKIDYVLTNDAPEEYYRNRFLCNAMVGLKMVDTIGSGIRKMYNCQRHRLFPTPWYDLSGERVTVTITGKIIDMNYANMLARNSNLSLMDIELLNRVQRQYFNMVYKRINLAAI